MMLKLSTLGNKTAYLNKRYKKFKDAKGKIYNGNKIVLIDSKTSIRYVTLSSYNKYYKNNQSQLIEVEEITSWPQKRDNLSISTKSGMYKQIWKSPRKNGTPSSTTESNRGTATTENVQQDAKNVH